MNFSILFNSFFNSPPEVMMQKLHALETKIEEARKNLSSPDQKGARRRSSLAKADVVEDSPVRGRGPSRFDSVLPLDG